MSNFCTHFNFFQIFKVLPLVDKVVCQRILRNRQYQHLGKSKFHFRYRELLLLIQKAVIHQTLRKGEIHLPVIKKETDLLVNRLIFLK